MSLVHSWTLRFADYLRRNLVQTWALSALSERGGAEVPMGELPMYEIVYFSGLFLLAALVPAPVAAILSQPGLRHCEERPWWIATESTI